MPEFFPRRDVVNGSIATASRRRRHRSRSHDLRRHLNIFLIDPRGFYPKEEPIYYLSPVGWCHRLRASALVERGVSASLYLYRYKYKKRWRLGKTPRSAKVETTFMAWPLSITHVSLAPQERRMNATAPSFDIATVIRYPLSPVIPYSYETSYEYS